MAGYMFLGFVVLRLKSLKIRAVWRNVFTILRFGNRVDAQCGCNGGFHSRFQRTFLFFTTTYCKSL